MYLTLNQEIWIRVPVGSQFQKDKIMFFSKSNSQGLVEFVLIVAVITIIVIAVLLLFGPTIGNVFSKINSSIPGYLE